MISFRFFLILSFFCMHSMMQPCVYSYPVADQNDLLFYIHQLKDGSLDLSTYHTKGFACAKKTYTFNQEMLHSYSHAHLCLLPSLPSTHEACVFAIASSHRSSDTVAGQFNAGYSFIDNGRLRVKYNHKHSPIAIDFIEPLYEIQDVIWLTDSRGIVCAKYREYVGIFYFTVDGRVETIVWTGKADYLYPQLVDDHLLYCIERCSVDGKTNYTIISCETAQSQIFSIDWDALSFDERVSILMGKNRQASCVREMASSSILYKTDMSVAHLHMVDHQQGFFVQHTAAASDAVVLDCSYYQLHKKGDIWHTKKLFDFTIPTELLYHPEKKLLETAVLAPVLHEGKLFFVDALGRGDTLGIFSYDLLTGQREDIMWHDGQLFFCPYFIGSTMFYGCDVT